VPPAHTQEGIYLHHGADQLLVSNSLVGLITAAELALDPTVDYPDKFLRAMGGIRNSPVAIPTSGEPIMFYIYENVRVEPDASLTTVAKPREAPFSSFADYRVRLSAALSSSMANAPGYEPVVSLSSGYDSTAVAVLASENGCRRAATFAIGKEGTSDSGAATAQRLGMRAEVFDRLAYLVRDDLAEAEFLATGMSGEDVIYSAMEQTLHRSMLLTGTRGNAVWRKSGRPRTDLSRSALDGASLTEFRLRVDCIHVPLPVFGMTQQPSVLAIAGSAEMRRFSVAGHYDQPVSRRIAEDAGIPRGTFAVAKRAAASIIHTVGSDALAPATRDSLAAFAAAEGHSAVFPPRFHPRLRHRIAVRVGGFLRLHRFVSGLIAKRKRLVHFEAEIGSLLFRWAVTVIRPRYAGFASEGFAPPSDAE
jgi:hypothetical protein